MKDAPSIVSPYESIAPYIYAHHIERVPALAEAIAGFIARWWREISAPPRPAWMIVAVREKRAGNELSLLFVPR